MGSQRRGGSGVPPARSLRGCIMLDIALSIAVLAAIALFAGAVVAFRRGDRQKALLMAVLALIALANVTIWTLPDASGEAPLAKVGQDLNR